MTLTCAATIFQPMGVRTQVCVCRPILPAPCRAGTACSRWQHPSRNVVTNRPFQGARQARRGAGRAEAGDLVVAVEILAPAVADDERIVPEEPVERFDVVW